VKYYHIPLSSDAFTGVGDPDADMHDRNVKRASKDLHKFCKCYAEAHNFHYETGNATKIAQSLHNYGINVRLLGKVRKHFMKSSSGRYFRHVLDGNGASKHTKFDPLMMAMIVRLLTGYASNYEVKPLFWQRDAKYLLHLKFPECLTPEEQHHDHDISQTPFVNMELCLYEVVMNRGKNNKISVKFSDDATRKILFFEAFVARAETLIHKIKADEIMNSQALGHSFDSRKEEVSLFK